MSRNIIIILLLGMLWGIVLWHPFHDDPTTIKPFLLDTERSVQIKWYIVDSNTWISRFLYMLIIHSLMGQVYPSRITILGLTTNSYLTLPFVIFNGYMYLAYVLKETDVPIHPLILSISLFVVPASILQKWR